MDAPPSDDPLGLVGVVDTERLAFGAVLDRRGHVVVHAAEHLELGRQVVAECLDVPMPVDDDDARRALLASVREELGVVHALCEESPVVARVLGVSAVVAPGGRWVPYVVRERFEGQRLDAYAAGWRQRLGRAPTPHEVLELLGPVARALAAAHRLGATHGDLHPGHVHVRDDGESVALRLMGLGPGAHGFRPEYGAPEHFDPNFGAVGPRTDVFSLALILVELLTGAPALRGSSPGALCLASTSREERPTPGARGVEVAAPFEAAMKRALAVEPADRFPDIDAMWRALTTALQAAGPSAAATPEPTRDAPTRIAEASRAPPGWRRLAAVALLVGIPAAALTVWLWTSRAGGADGDAADRASAAAPPDLAPTEDLLRARTPADLEALAQRHPGDPAPLRQLALLEDDAKRHVEAVRAVRLVVARSPKLAEDVAMQAVVLRAVHAGEEARRSALDLLETGMHAAGPDLLYQLTQDAKGDRALSGDVERRLTRPSVLERATPAARIAIDLRATKSPCERRKLFERAGRHGDARSLPWLTPLLSRTGCGFLSTGDCSKCLGNRADLEEAVAAIRARAGAP